jgi:hypothetical protein
MPVKAVIIDKSSSITTKRLSRVYNRLGGLLEVVADTVRAEAAGALAVWYVESAGRDHIPNQAIIRFENDVFFDLWGKTNEATYSQYFRHGGFQGTPGKRYQNHSFRERLSAKFEPVNTGKQAPEYRALFVARTLSRDGSLQAISIGGCQIMIFNYSRLGYNSATDMYNAFQASERAHVLGFFDFCVNLTPHDKILVALNAMNWTDFARAYNGSGQVTEYAKRMSAAY